MGSVINLYQSVGDFLALTVTFFNIHRYICVPHVQICPIYKFYCSWKKIFFFLNDATFTSCEKYILKELHYVLPTLYMKIFTSYHCTCLSSNRNVLVLLRSFLMNSLGLWTSFPIFQRFNKNFPSLISKYIQNLHLLDSACFCYPFLRPNFYNLKMNYVFLPVFIFQ